MNYIVLDLEWNQPISKDSPSYQEYGNYLTSEIIQFGAVKLNGSKSVISSFRSVVSPKCYRTLHHHVEQLTSLTQRDIDSGLPFPVIAQRFRKWCGEEGSYAFLTWGYDDIPTLAANLMFYKMETEWLNPWYNLQIMFNDQEGQDTNQKGLSSVIEYYHLQQKNQFHDALNDARYTAMVAARLDLKQGMMDYQKLVNPLILGVKGVAPPLETIRAQNIINRKTIFVMKEFAQFSCPNCKKVIAESISWVKQSGDKYIYVAECPQHGAYLLRLRILKGGGETFMALRTAEEADEDIVKAYHVREAKELERIEIMKLKKNAKTEDD